MLANAAAAAAATLVTRTREGIRNMLAPADDHRHDSGPARAEGALAIEAGTPGPRMLRAPAHTLTLDIGQQVTFIEGDSLVPGQVVAIAGHVDVAGPNGVVVRSIPDVYVPVPNELEALIKRNAALVSGVGASVTKVSDTVDILRTTVKLAETGVYDQLKRMRDTLEERIGITSWWHYWLGTFITTTFWLLIYVLFVHHS